MYGGLSLILHNAGQTHDVGKKELLTNSWEEEKHLNIVNAY